MKGIRGKFTESRFKLELNPYKFYLVQKIKIPRYLNFKSQIQIFNYKIYVCGIVNVNCNEKFLAKSFFLYIFMNKKMLYNYKEM